MGRRWQTLDTLILVTATVFGLAASVADGANAAPGGIPTMKELTGHISSDRAIDDAQSVTFSLETGQTCVLHRKASSENDLDRILVHVSATHLYHYCFTARGKLLCGGGDPIGEGNATRLSIDPAFATRLSWTVREGRADITCLVETDEKMLAEKVPGIFGKAPTPGLTKVIREEEIGTPAAIRIIEAQKPRQETYQMGSEASFLLRDGQALCLIPSDTQFAAKKIYLYYKSHELYYQNLWADGDVSGDVRITEDNEPSSPSFHSHCDFKQYPNAPDRAQIVFWEPTTDGVRVRHFSDSGSPESRRLAGRLRREFDQVSSRDKKLWSERSQKSRKVLRFDNGQAFPAVTMTMEGTDNEYLVRLRSNYDLPKLIAAKSDDLSRLIALTDWVHQRWEHSGDNVPSKPDPITILEEAAKGKRFRCVEYANVLAAAARSVGMPSRILGLKSEDVLSSSGGAGHLVAEVWLESLKKWAFADGQWDFVPSVNGVPLNAVELQRAIVESRSLLVNLSRGSKTSPDAYADWVFPYLVYLDFSPDQRFGTAGSEADRLSHPSPDIMLVPVGKERPAAFQRRSPFKNVIYTANVGAFYANP
jgi:hypothetical protein